MMNIAKTAAAAAMMIVAASTANAVSVTPFDTPLNPPDTTSGQATALAFENFSNTILSFQAASDMMVEADYTIDRVQRSVSGTPGHSISLAYSIDLGPFVGLPIGFSSANMDAGGVQFSLMAGNTVNFQVSGRAGQLGNTVAFMIDTKAPAVVPVPAAGGMALLALATLAGFGRRKPA